MTKNNFSECSMHKQAKCLIITICALLNGCASQKPETSSQNILTDTTVSSLEDALYDFEIIPDVLEDEPPHVIKLIEDQESDPWKVEHPNKTSYEIITELKKHEIIPDIIDKVAYDVSVCEVSYNDTVINFGNIINYTYIWEHEPTHVKWPYEEGVLYTLIMTSPDAPGREEHNERELRLWLVGNIPGNDIKNGTLIADYAGMVPFYEEGLHRYVFFVYEQEDAGKIDFSNEMFLTPNDINLSRAYHHSEDFRETYQLGPIIATNFYLMDYRKIRH
ncbi:OV-16 antigen isoform X2 [Bemisia tabaci]|uniref:OV-16 antigen isoform X2 n=1 Tax=Bemisia tabaci TaxID=7038 RepID=UPI003B28310D